MAQHTLSDRATLCVAPSDPYLQVQRGGGGLSAVLRDVWREGGGPGGLFKGLGAATLRLIPMAIVSFGTYELVRSALIALEDYKEARAVEEEYSRLHSFLTPLTLSGSSGGGLAGCGVPCSPTAAAAASASSGCVLPLAPGAITAGAAVNECGAAGSMTGPDACSTAACVGAAASACAGGVASAAGLAGSAAAADGGCAAGPCAAPAACAPAGSCQTVACGTPVTVVSLDASIPVTTACMLPDGTAVAPSACTPCGTTAAQLVSGAGDGKG